MNLATAADKYLLAESVFSPYVCNFCKHRSDNNKTCQGCKLVSYCSLEHQKNHWLHHKSVCKAVSTVLKKFKACSIFDIAPDERNWQTRRSLAMCLSETVLKEPLNPLERQLFMFPAACFECKISKIDKSLICTNCVSIAYCSTEHKLNNEEKHSAICKELKLCFDISCSMVKKDYYYNLNLKILKNLKENHTFPRTMRDLINLFNLDYSNNHITEAITSEMLTCVATLVYVIEKRNILNKLSDEIKVIFVGSEATTGLESSLVKNVNFIPYIYPTLKRIVLTFVGPTNNEPIMPSDRTDNLTHNSVTINYQSQLYHDFISSADYSQPDVICIFNSGFHVKDNAESDPWLKTIPELYGSKYLTFFTSYNQDEAIKDFDRFIQMKPKEKHVEVVSSAVENPFRSYRPYRDWENDGIFYQNNFISILEMQSS